MKQKSYSNSFKIGFAKAYKSSGSWSAIEADEELAVDVDQHDEVNDEEEGCTSSLNCNNSPILILMLKQLYLFWGNMWSKKVTQKMLWSMSTYLQVELDLNG